GNIGVAYRLDQDREICESVFIGGAVSFIDIAHSALNLITDPLRLSWSRTAGDASLRWLPWCGRAPCCPMRTERIGTLIMGGERVSKVFSGRNQGQHERKDQDGASATLGARLHPSDSAVLPSSLSLVPGVCALTSLEYRRCAW